MVSSDLRYFGAACANNITAYCQINKQTLFQILNPGYESLVQISLPRLRADLIFWSLDPYYASRVNDTLFLAFEQPSC